ncbi:MAG: T9SS type A sorting domain-containing protein [Gracilimonas sp.]|nr:T9SS type A sorting domain-containing protein [Gracilimonas sp.]
MKKLIFLIIALGFTFLGIRDVNAQDTSWDFEGSFPSDSFEYKDGIGGIHGLVADNNGKIWIHHYFAVDTIDVNGVETEIAPLFIFNEDGSQTSLSPIQSVQLEGETHYFEAAGARGLTLTNNGDILISNDDQLILVDANTGEAINHYEAPNNSPLTKASVADDGTIAVGYVFPDLPVHILDENLNQLYTTSTIPRFKRTVEITDDASKIYVMVVGQAGSVNEQRTVIYENDGTGNDYEYVGDLGILTGVSVESSDMHNGNLWVSGGSSYETPANNNFEPNTWYEIDLNTNEIINEISWQSIADEDNLRPRGITFSGNKAYIGQFNSTEDPIVQVFSNNSIRTIEDARNLSIGATVTVKGVVTTPDYRPNGTTFFIQDETAGINIFNAAARTVEVAEGDSVEITGKIKVFNGLVEIVPDDVETDIKILNSDNPLPEPQVITYDEFVNAADPSTDSQELQGSLVTIMNISTDPLLWPADGNSFNGTATDTAGNQYTIRVWENTDAAMYTPSAGYFDLTGVLGSYNQTQISPFYASDFDYAESPVIMEKDSLVLVDLYNNTNGEEWNNNENWLQGSVHTWYGVEISESRVVGLDLSNNNLKGVLPDSLGQLDQLTYLDLSENEISGSIPASLSSLSNLELLYLYLNPDLSGTLPASFAQLENLERLSINNTSISGEIPDAWGDLKKLNFLRLERTDLSGSIPESFINLTNLNVFYVNETGVRFSADNRTKGWIEGISDFRSSGMVELSPPKLVLPENEEAAQPIPALLSWNGGTNADRYKIELYSDEALSDTVLILDFHTDSWISIDSITHNTEYFWRVASGTNYGLGAWSAISSFKTILDTETGPKLLSPEFESDSVEIPVSFSWSEVEGAQTYYLEISTTPSFDTTSTVKMLSGAEYIYQNAVDDTSYFWRVRGEANGIAGGWSATGVFNTELRPPETPTWEPEDGAENVPVENVLAWNSSERADTYNLQLADNEDFETLIIDQSGLEETELEVSLEGQTTYYWRIQAVNSSGSSEWSSAASFTTEMTTGIGDEEALPDEFAIHQNYPNPFNPTTVISYQIPVNSDVELKVFDMLGREIRTLVRERKTAGSYEVNFDASSLSSGMYIYRIQAGNYLQTKKMMLIK